MKAILGKSLLALSIAWAGIAAADGQGKRDSDDNKIHHRMNHEPPELNPDRVIGDALTAGGTGTLSTILFHGGPVMAGAPDVHLIWYGNWAQGNGSDNAAGQQIVRDFLGSVSGSNWMKINPNTPVTLKGYTGSGGTAVSGNIATVHSTNFGYLAGKTRLTDKNIATVVANCVNTQGGASTNAIYFVLTSTDVTATSGFCTQYCGWHTKGTVAGVANVKYSFVGNANRCLSGCAAQSTGPNGNAGVDGMLSVLMHELEETLTDPNPRSGWTDSTGYENADKCAWTFGSAQATAPNGASYNLTLAARAGGTRNYLIQRNMKIDSKCYVTSTGQQ